MWRFFNIAKKAALSKQDKRSFLLGCIGIRADGAIVKSCNGSVLMFDDMKRNTFPKAHAEARLAKKLNKNSIVFVCRIKKIDGKYGMAKPCKDCQAVLASRGVTKVYYTIDENEYGVLTLDRGGYIDKENEL